MTSHPSRSAEWVPPHPPLRTARQRHLQGQYRARQRTDRYASGSDASGRARQYGPTRQRRGRRLLARPLLRRPHDHRRELRARRRTARPAIAPSRAQDRDGMTPVTASSHLPPDGEPCFRRCIAVAPPPPKAGATPSIMRKSPRRRPPRQQPPHRDRRSAAADPGQRIPYASRHSTKFP